MDFSHRTCLPPHRQHPAQVHHACVVVLWGVEMNTSTFSSVKVSSMLYELPGAVLFGARKATAARMGAVGGGVSVCPGSQRFCSSFAVMTRLRQRQPAIVFMNQDSFLNLV